MDSIRSSEKRLRDAYAGENPAHADNDIPYMPITRAIWPGLAKWHHDVDLERRIAAVGRDEVQARTEAFVKAVDSSIMKQG